MNIHIMTSRQSLETDIETLRRIIRIVRDSGHTVVDEWLEEAYELLIQHRSGRPDWSTVFKKRQEAITKADIIIGETSYENFAVGYQVALAVQQKKPVLLLRKANADKNAFVTGVVDDWVQHMAYTSETLEDTVCAFIKENDIPNKDMRFNFFIDRPIYNYLRWTSLKTGKTKAEILRELVEKEIDHTNS